MAQMVTPGHSVDAEYLRQIEGARKDFHDLLSHNKQFAPTVLRLAFHDAGTYDAKPKTGGTNGSVRNELGNAPNVGMKAAVDFCEQVKKKHTKISYADLYQIGGITAVEVTGGPKIHFVPGRQDAPQQQADQGTLPNPNGGVKDLRDIFRRMGLNDKDIVVLSGAHTLGRAHKERSGFDGPFTKQPLKFDNSYYKELLKGDTPGLVKFPTDKALLQDPVFRGFVECYARDEKAFFKDYVESHKKLSELGFNPNSKVSHPQPHPQPRSHSQVHVNHHQQYPSQHTSHFAHACPFATAHHCPPPPCSG